MTTLASRLRIVGATLVIASMVGLGPIGYYWWHSRTAFAAAQKAAGTPVQPIVLPQDPNVISGHPVSIDIPSVNISLPIIDGFYDPDTGEWTLTLNKAQFATPTVEPNNLKGNTLIYGHYRREVFAYLHLIKPGATATITTDNGYVFTYKYTSTEVFDPADTSVFLYQGAPRLTVQTCSGAFFQHRQMYYFDFQEVHKAN